MNFKEYKEKLRRLRKQAAEWQPEGWDMEPAQNPSDPFIEAQYGPWRAVWKGGRTADIYHAESDTAMDLMQVGAYDWQNGRLVNPPTQQSLTERLKQWADESGGDYERNMLPYS